MIVLQPQKLSTHILFGFLLGLTVIPQFSCKDQAVVKSAFNADQVHLANQTLIEITMEDVFNPPVATRIFAYPNLVAHEVLNHQKGSSFMNQALKDSIFTIPDGSAEVDYTIASMAAFCDVAKKLVFSEYMIDSLMVKFHDQAITAGQSEAVWKESLAYGQAIAESFNTWASKDNYAKVKAADQYLIQATDSSWVLTPPNYEQALEPNWKNMRPIFIKDLNEFKPKPRPIFSTDKTSEFYTQAKLVYSQSKINGAAEKKTALYWDDNPNEFNDAGHNVHFKHKVSPPAHWINITRQISISRKENFASAVSNYSAVATAMYDGIIVCWFTKFTEQLVRPVTYIHKYVDKTWQPLIQTPPFPEYTSGHSTVSGTASSILERIYPQTSFTDSTEVPFGFEPRTFDSFYAAGQEASDSRFYGGIHYKFGVDNGFENGKQIGNFIISLFNH
ncbi:MAG: vanadium-dependent haloperoxidase [Saprospiraceae bacterium]|nr:vanadium-dependent haloperoxidase [Saprospiraceae bacterium]